MLKTSKQYHEIDFALFKISATSWKVQAESPAQSIAIAVALVQAAQWLKTECHAPFKKSPLCSGSLALQIS